MRISDWSSVVCSAYLVVQFLPVLKHRSFAGGPVDAVRIFLNEVALHKLGCSSSHFHHRVTIERRSIQNGVPHCTCLLVSPLHHQILPDHITPVRPTNVRATVSEKECHYVELSVDT